MAISRHPVWAGGIGTVLSRTTSGYGKSALPGLTAIVTSPLPLAKRKGTRASAARSHGMPGAGRGQHPPNNQHDHSQHQHQTTTTHHSPSRTSAQSAVQTENLTLVIHMYYFKNQIDGSTQRCADVCRPSIRTATGRKREEMKANGEQTTLGLYSRVRPNLLRRRPAPHMGDGERLRRPCRSVGGQVPGARRISPASQYEPAGESLSVGAIPCGRPRTICPAKGRETTRGADRRLLLPAARGRLQRE